MAQGQGQGHGHEQSLAYLQQKGNVTNFKLVNNAQAVDHSKMQSVAQLNDAQLVKKNAPNYVEKPQDSIQLQKGPPKKVINIDQTTDNTNYNQSNINNNNSNNNNDNIDNFLDNNNDDDGGNNNNNNNNSNLDDFFGDNNNDNNNNLSTNQQQTKKGGNNYKTMISLDGDASAALNDDDNDDDGNGDDNNVNNNNIDDFLGGGNNDNEIGDENIDIGGDNYDDMGGFNDVDGDNNEDNDKKEDIDDDKKKETFLSVWQEQRREELLNKGKSERDEKNKAFEVGRDKLKEFNDKRAQKIEQNRKNVKGKENALRDDFDSVFKNGTIWEQVARLVDLKSKEKEIERMRDLLIQLKNQDKNKNN